MMATNAGPLSGRFIVDVRVFMLSMTICMAASFFAGVTMGPDSNVTSVTMDNRSPPHLDLSGDLLAKSLEHPPSGQHLLVDIANVATDFLDSEERLSKAMIETVKETGLTMLSYHCHKLSPAGISCVGVLMESHISFHTWPEEGVITLDLFTCGPHALLPTAVETMEKLFGIKRSEEKEVRVKWSHELRGFRPEGDEKSKNAIDKYSDLNHLILSPLDLYSKKQVYSKLTKFHRVDIWDAVDLDESPTHEDGIKHGLAQGDPRWETPELVSPSRMLFLNGFLVRCAGSDHETQESLVHPGMFAHTDPKHVAIVGGWEGGALREVLKHNTLKSATLIAQDKELVNISRKLFPAQSDCSDLVGRARDCFEDEIVNVFHADPKEFFKRETNYGARKSATKFDFILVDHEDPRHSPEFFTDPEYISSLVKALSLEGVLSISVGMAPDIDDPRADQGVYFVREQLMRQLESNPDVKAMLVYEEPRTGFADPTAMLVVCKSETCRSRWYARSDQVDFAIYERIVRTHSNERALHHFDGTTQFSYSIPPKAWETNYCKRQPKPFECDYLHLDPTKKMFDWDPENDDDNSFHVDHMDIFRIKTHEELKEEEKDGKLKEFTDSHVFATVDIPAGSYIMPNHLASSLIITENNLDGLTRNLNVGGGPVSVIEDLLDFIGQHGHASHTDGTGAHFVEIGGTVLIQTVDTPEEANVGRWVPPHPSGHTPVYSPVYERHRVSFDVFIVATKDIKRGDQLFRYKDMWKRDDE